MIRLKRLLLFLSVLVVALLVGVCGLWVGLAKRQYALNRQLIAALENNAAKQALALVEAGADPNTRSDAPLTPSFKILLLRFLRHSPKSSDDSHTALMIVCGTVETPVTFPLTEQDRRRQSDTLLRQKAETLALTRAMLAHGAQINAPSKPTAGDASFSYPLIAATESGQIEVVRELLAHGAKVDVENSREETSLWIIAGYNIEITRLLLDAGADIEAKNNGGCTVLGNALNGVTLGTDDRIVRLLIARHANVNGMRDKDVGNYYLWLAHRFNEPNLTNLLKNAGARK